MFVISKCVKRALSVSVRCAPNKMQEEIMMFVRASIEADADKNRRKTRRLAYMPIFVVFVFFVFYICVYVGM